MFAQEQLERAVHDMRAQFQLVSGQITEELGRLTEYVATLSPAVRERVITATTQITTTQLILRAEADRLPADPHERYAIMESVLQSQQGVLHLLAIIVKQNTPGWYPNMSRGGGAWSQPNLLPPPTTEQNGATTVWPAIPQAAPSAEEQSLAGPSWPPNLPATQMPEQGTAYANGWTPAPSPPTLQEVLTHGWSQAQSNGYPTDLQPAPGQSAWPTAPGNAGGRAVAAYQGGYPDANGTWPGRLSHPQMPAQMPAIPPQYAVLREVPPPPRGHGAGGHAASSGRRRGESLVTAGTSNLIWIGIVVLAVIFTYLTFGGGQRGEARQKPAQEAEQRMAPVADPPSAAVPRVLASPPSQPTLLARAPEEEPQPLPQAQTQYRPLGPTAPTTLPSAGTLTTSAFGSAIGSTIQPSTPLALGPPPQQAPQPDPMAAARAQQRVAPSRGEPQVAVQAPPQPAPAPPAAARADRFVPVIFTHQDEAIATQAYVELQQQFPGLLANRHGEAQAVDFGKKGVWHRVVVLPAGSRQDASELCSQLTGAGYSRCWVKPY